MKKVSETIAKQLLQIKAIKLQPANPFTWASGWNSPIYCDNRKTLSYPEVRDYIKSGFVALVNELYPQVDVIAGVATGAIAQGAWWQMPWINLLFMCALLRRGMEWRT